MKSLSAITTVVTLVLAVGGPVVSGLLSYESAMGDTRTEFVRLRLESEKSFVQKNDFKEIADVLHSIDKRLSVIEAQRRR